MKPINLRIAEELGVREQQVAAAISLLDGGATVPFVARYRKEATHPWMLWLGREGRNTFAVICGAPGKKPSECG
jgi:hypothetical protein